MAVFWPLHPSAQVLCVCSCWAHKCVTRTCAMLPRCSVCCRVSEQSAKRGTLHVLSHSRICHSLPCGCCTTSGGKTTMLASVCVPQQSNAFLLIWSVQNIPTIPSTLQEELETNPFLRPEDPAIRKNLGQNSAFSVLLYSAILQNLLQASLHYVA